MLKRVFPLTVVLWISLLATPATAAPITDPMVDDAMTYRFDGSGSIDLSASAFDNPLNTRSGGLWFKAMDTAPLQMLYEEGGRINGLNIWLDRGQVNVGAWANALGGVNGWTLIGNKPAGQLGTSSFYTGLLAGVSYDSAALLLSDIDDMATRTLPNPLPPAALLLGSGLAGLVLLQRRRHLRS